jgi:hypothetical protein
VEVKYAQVKAQYDKLADEHQILNEDAAKHKDMV